MTSIAIADPPRRRGATPRLVASALAPLVLLLVASAGRAGGTVSPDPTEWNALLSRYVTPKGVRYAAWHAHAEDRDALARYLERLQAADVAALMTTSAGRKEALAYWINLYNAATVDLVLDGYPVKSIRDLGDAKTSPWERPVVTVQGRALTLDALENEVIRPEFREPRVHFALNCAAKSCPPLRAEAYVADRLEQQLEEQTKAFLADPASNAFDGERRLTLSRIFEWYAKDFEASGPVVAWVRRYVPGLGALPPDHPVEIRYGEYDWSLNEARP